MVDAGADAWSRLRAGVIARIGLDLAQTVDRAAVERLAKRCAADAGVDVDRWVQRALASPSAATEWSDLVAAVANGHTWFFREPQALDAAVAHLRTTTKATAWSAACSSGQETWSLAMACAAGGAVVDIVGTDVNDRALAVARSCLYDDRGARGLPPNARRYVDAVGAGVRVRAHELPRVRFELHSLTDAPPGTFDVVLCRNVLFYFAPDVLPAVLQRLSAALKPGGLLILGAAETRHAFATSLTMVSIAGRVCFQRAPTPTTTTSTPPMKTTATTTTTSAPTTAAEPMVALERGHDAFLARDFAKAAAAYADAVALDTVWWEPHLFLGLAERKRGRFDVAAGCFERALFLEPHSWEAALLLAGCYRRAARDDDATREERRARRLLDDGAVVPLATPASIATKILPSVDEALATVVR